MWREAKKKLENIFFPVVHCALCGDKTSLDYLGLCEGCLANLRRLDQDYVACDFCGNYYDRHFHSCPRCFQKRKPRSYQKVVACYPYAKEAKQLVLKLKFANGRYLAEAMAKLMREKTDLGEGGKYGALVPVPLSDKRFKEREYNQCEILAAELSAQSGIPLRKKIIKKIKETECQVNLSGLERERNVIDAFALGEDRRIEGARLILIDDVITTGATLNECAKTLKRGGAKSIKVVTFCGTGTLKD